MPTASSLVRAISAAVCLLATARSLPAPARAQVFVPNTCATLPEGEAANVRAIAGTCGTVAFPIDAQLLRLGAVRVAVGGNLYIRVIRLVYQSAGGAQQQTQIPLHRLLVDGDITDPIPATRSGLSLVSVAVDVNPPGYGAGQILIAVIGPEGSEANAALPASNDAVRNDNDGWLLIGSTSAHLTVARDTLTIGRDKGRFDGISIASRGNDLPVQSVIISPASGVPYSVDVRRVIAPGANSFAIRIDPPDFLHEVTVTYGTAAPSSRSSLLEVRGHYSETWLGNVGDNRHYAGGWILLGTADVVISPHRPMSADKLRIAGQAGPFKKLRFVARRGAVSLGSVAVDVGDGRRETVPINALLMPNVQSTAIALSSGAVPIQSLTISPQYKSSSRIDATVEVWAQY